MFKKLPFMILILTLSLFIVTPSYAGFIEMRTINVPYCEPFDYTYSSPEGMEVFSGYLEAYNDSNDTYHLVLFMDGEIVNHKELPGYSTKTINITTSGSNLRLECWMGDYPDRYGSTRLEITGGLIRVGTFVTGKTTKENVETAKNAAQNAESAANDAHSDAQAASNQTWYNGNESAYWAYYGKVRAQQARDNASAARNDADYIRGTQLPNLSNDVANTSSKVSTAINRATVSRNIANDNSTKLDNLDTKVASIESTVNKIQSRDTTPPNIKKVEGLNQATATETSTFNVVVEANDNQDSSLVFKVKADTGSSWSSWTSTDNPAIATGISGSGAHNISVKVKDSAGNIATSQLTIFKI